MIEEKQNEIINKLDNSKEVKRFKELGVIIKKNDRYNEIISNFNRDLSNEEIISLRKELFEIDGVSEYAKIENEIRLLSKNISKIISSVVDNTKCK